MIRYLRVLSYFLAILGCMALNADNSSASAIAIDNNGKLVIAGSTQNSQTQATEFAITRLNTDGTPDVTFNPSGAPLGSNSTTSLTDFFRYDSFRHASLSLALYTGQIRGRA